MKNLKILALSLLAMNAGLSSASAVQSARLVRDGVTISVAAGVANTLSTSFDNETRDNPPLVPCPPVATSTTNLSGNSFANFNPANIVPPATGATYKYNQSGSGQADVTILNGYVLKSSDSKPDSSILPTASTIDLSTRTGPQTVDLFKEGTVKDTIFYNPFLDYSNVSSLNGGSGVDVTGTVGYSFSLTSSLALRPMVGFSYINASSVNAIDTRYNQYQFASAAGTLTVQGTGQSTAVETPFYAIDRFTYDQSGIDNTLSGAFTMAAQWSFHVSTGLTFFATDAFSVEGQVGYQMTHFKLAALGLGSSGQTAAINSVYVPASDANKQIESSNLLTSDKDGKVAYPDITKNATETFESSLNLSGVRLGISFNFALTNNLSMNLNTYYVKNFKRDFSIDDITIAQIPPAATAAKTDAAAAAGGNTTTPSTTPAQNTTTPNYTKQSFSGSLSQDIAGFTMGFTYTIPVGGNNCNPAS